MARPLSDREHAVLRAWLSFDVESANELRSHLESGPLVESSCECGCASLCFVDDTEGADVVDAGVFPIDAGVLNSAGESIGGMILFTKDGCLHDIDVHAWAEAFEFPNVDHVRFFPNSDA